MFPAIGRNHSKSVLLGRVDRVVEEDDLIRHLNDFGRRAYPRKTFWRALERRVLMTLMRSQVFYLLNQFGLIRRQIGTFQPVLQFSHFVGRLNGSLSRALCVERL